MSMTEAERHELYELAKREVGDRFAQLMIKAMPPEPERLATKDDLGVVRSDLRAEMAGLRTELKTEMADLRTELKTEMADLRTELRTEMGQLRTEFKTEMGQLRTDLRTDVAQLRVDFAGEINAAFAAQTRTMIIGLVSAVILIAFSNALAVLAG